MWALAAIAKRLGSRTFAVALFLIFAGGFLVKPGDLITAIVVVVRDEIHLDNIRKVSLGVLVR